MILGRSLERNARMYAARPAIVAEDGATITHAELCERVWRLADGILALGLGKGSRAGILARNSAEYLTLYFALGCVGIWLVPLNFLLKVPDLEMRMRHAELDALFLDAEFLPVVGDLDENVRARLQDRVIVMDGAAGGRSTVCDLVAQGRPRLPSVELTPEDILYIGYTSGTTGTPKGALVSHRAIVGGYLYKALDYRLTCQDVSINAGPYWHSAPRDFATLAIYLGGTAIVPERFDPDAYLALVERHRATNAFVVPTMLERIVASPSLGQRDTSSLRCLISGGAPLPSAVKERVLAAFGPALTEFYGATETRIVTAITSAELARHDRSVGRPTGDVQLRVLDEDGRALPDGEVGEIYLRGPGLFSGYWRDPERTAAAHRGAWFSLGDMGRLDVEGFLYLVDRKQDMIISGGENIFPNDVEECLLRHPGVREAAVVGAPDDRWGEVVVAYVVPASADVPSADELATFCGEHLPGYMKPRRVEFCEGLPRNPTGKLLRREVRRLDGERSAALKTSGIG